MAYARPITIAHIQADLDKALARIDARLVSMEAEHGGRAATERRNLAKAGDLVARAKIELGQ